MINSAMFHPISRASSIPLYIQVRDTLLEAISSGRLQEGSLLPSEPELCRIFQISRASLRQAVQELAHQGMLRRERGRGTFVTQATPQMRLPLMKGLTEAMTQLGAKVTSV